MIYSIIGWISSHLLVASLTVIALVVWWTLLKDFVGRKEF